MRSLVRVLVLVVVVLSGLVAAPSHADDPHAPDSGDLRFRMMLHEPFLSPRDTATADLVRYPQDSQVWIRTGCTHSEPDIEVIGCYVHPDRKQNGLSYLSTWQPGRRDVVMWAVGRSRTTGRQVTAKRELWYHVGPITTDPDPGTDPDPDPATGPVVTATAETQAFGDAAWTPTTTEEPTTAGNPTRIRYSVADVPAGATVHLRLLDSAGHPVEGSSASVEMPAGPLERTVLLDTWSKAFAPDGTPHPGAWTYTLEAGTAGRPTTRREIAVQVLPRPVVLVHGYNSSAAAWTGFEALLQDVHPGLRAHAVGDGRFDGLMDTGDLLRPWRPTNTVAENAAQEAQYVDDLRRTTGAHHVDLVAHSMGGLISRRYIQDLMPASTDDRPVVGHLVQLGTPNRGSPCADMLTEMSVVTLNPLIAPQPATYELTTFANASFNADVTDLRGVELSNLVGTGIPIPCGPYVGDVVVPTWSARWTLGVADRLERSIIHTAMTADAGVVQDYVVPRLADAPGTGVARSAAVAAAAVDEQPEQPTEAATTFDVQTLRVPAGGHASATLDVPAGRRLGVTAVAPGVSLQLVDPAGRTRDTAAAPDGAMPISGLAGDDVTAGRWTVRASTTGDAVDVPISAWVQGNPVTVDVVRSDGDAHGMDLAVEASSAGAPVRNASVTARMLDGDRPADPVVLHDDGRGSDATAGDGVYSARTSQGPSSERPLISFVVDAGTSGRRYVSAPLRPVAREKPVIRSGPQPRRAQAGRTASFTVDAIGDISAYAWQRRLPGGDWTTLAGQGLARLDGRTTDRTLDGALVRAVFTGPGGSVTTEPATLHVSRAATTASASFRVSRTARGRAVVTVTAAGLVPRGTVTVHDGRRRIASGRLTARGTVTLRVPRLSRGTHVLRVRYAGSSIARPDGSTPRRVRIR